MATDTLAKSESGNDAVKEHGKHALKDLAHGTGQFSTFFVGDMFFGVDVLNVQEVLRFQPMTPVPQAPKVIEGLINLRGQIVTAIDLRRRLGVADRGPDQRPMNVVVRTDDGAVSLLVDEIGDVLEVDASSYEHAPDTLDDAHRAAHSVRLSTGPSRKHRPKTQRSRRYAHSHDVRDSRRPRSRPGDGAIHRSSYRAARPPARIHTRAHARP